MKAPGQGQPPQAPGQAAPPGQGQPPMPGMQPGAGGPQAGISSDRIPDLAKLNEQMLVQLFNLSMMGQIPNPSPISVLAAISEKQKQKQAIAAVQGAMAQGQNAQNQQGGTIAQQIMAPLMQRRAAHGGVMHGYADGGAVAFQFGGDAWRKRLIASGVPEAFIKGEEARGLTPEEIETNARREGLLLAQTSPVIDQRDVARILQKGPATRSPEENAMLRAAGVPLVSQTPAQEGSPIQRLEEFLKRPFIREAITGGAQTLSAQELAQRSDTGALTEKMARALGASQVEPPPPPRIPSFPGKSGEPDVDVGAVQSPQRPIDTRAIPAPTVRPDTAVKERPPGQRPAAVVPSATTTQADQELQNYLSELRTRRGLPEDVLSGRAGIEALAAEEMKERKERLAQDRAAAEERRREVMERAPGVFSPEGLLAIAASIDPRRGYELGSAAKGAFGVMAGQRKAQEEARKEFREFERAERTEQNLLSQMRTLEAQRQQAIREKDVDRANAITDKLYTTQQDYQRLKEDLRLKQEKLEIDRLTAEAAKSEGQAKAQTARAQLESLGLSRQQSAISNAQLRLVNLIDKRKEVPAGILGPMAAMFSMDEKKFAETYPDKYQEVKKALASYDKDIADARARLNDLLGEAEGIPSGVKVKRTGP